MNALRKNDITLLLYVVSKKRKSLNNQLYFLLHPKLSLRVRGRWSWSLLEAQHMTRNISNQLRSHVVQLASNFRQKMQNSPRTKC